MSQKFKSEIELQALNNATTDTDKFLVSDSGVVKYRTGAQVLSDIGGQAVLTNPVTGTGTTNYVSKWTGTNTQGNSQIFDNGTNVLIGNTSNFTSNKVQIQTTGSSRLLSLYNTTANGGAKIEFFDGTSNGAIGNLGSNLVFYINSRDTERMRITSTGNVGIGTTSPSAKLDLGTSGALKVTQSGVTEVYVEGTGVRLKNIYTGGGWARGILTYENSTGTDYFQLGGYGSGQSFIYGYIGSAYNNNALRWYPNNNVFVGNDLDVNGNISIPFNTGNKIGFAVTDTFSADSTTIAQYGITNAGSLGQWLSGYWGLKFATAGSEKMRITSAGDVGIGTTTTQGKLHIRQTANLGGLVGNSLILQTLENSGGTSGNQVFIKDYAYRDAAGTGWSTWRHHNSIDIDGAYNTPGTNTRTFWERDPLSELHIFGSTTRKVLTIDASSNQRVGINIDTPSYPLHVSGNVSNISIYATNDIVAFSDQSVKTNIRPIENALERVVKSRGVLYDRTDSKNKDNIGFIAQELEVNFPELVVTNEDGTKAVKYQNTVAVLFEAIKEQQKQIEELKQIVNGFTK